MLTELGMPEHLMNSIQTRRLPRFQGNLKSLLRNKKPLPAARMRSRALKRIEALSLGISCHGKSAPLNRQPIAPDYNWKHRQLNLLLRAGNEREYSQTPARHRLKRPKKRRPGQRPRILMLPIRQYFLPLLLPAHSKAKRMPLKA